MTAEERALLPARSDQLEALAKEWREADRIERVAIAIRYFAVHLDRETKELEALLEESR